MTDSISKSASSIASTPTESYSQKLFTSASTLGHPEGSTLSVRARYGGMSFAETKMLCSVVHVVGA